jgi:hypothetical protein
VHGGLCIVVRTMAMRECLSSAARYQARVSADAILEKPIGSKTLPPVSTPTPSLHKKREAACHNTASHTTQSGLHTGHGAHVGDAHARGRR